MLFWKSFSLSILVGFFIGVSFLGYIVFAFNSPTEVPPTQSSIYAPIHTGSETQIKAGDLWANSLGTTGGIYVGGYLQLAETTGAPPASDCDNDLEKGRMKYDPGADAIFTCNGTSGWATINAGSAVTCYRDADGDGRTTSEFVSAIGSCPVGYQQTQTINDCLDSGAGAATVYQSISNLADDTDKDLWYTGSLATRCVGAKTGSWYKDIGGTDKWLASGDASGASDCSVGDSTRWRTRYDDANDCRSTSACVGNHAGYFDSPVKFTVFVSNSSWTGNLGGSSGADAKCNAAAANAFPSPLPGNYTAWISTSASDEPRDRGLNTCASAGGGSVGWYETNGTKIADNWSDLTDNTLDAAITRQEDGADLYGKFVWTSTDSVGNATSTRWCNGYTSGSSGVQGWNSYNTQTTSWSLNTNAVCSAVFNLYCFQNSP